MANTTTPNISLLEPALGDSSWNTPLNFNFTQIDSCFGGTVPAPAIAVTGAFTEGSAGVVGWSSNANPTLAVADTGLSRTAAKTIAVGNGTQGDATGTLKAAVVTVADGSVGAPTLAFNSSGTGSGFFQFAANNIGLTVNGVGKQQWLSSGVFFAAGVPLGWETGVINSGTDIGLSRPSAGVLAIGNGTQGDTTGNLQLALITKYAGLTTAGTGVSTITAITSQKVEAAADAALLSFTPPALAGSYRLRCVISVTSATAAVLGWTATWTDSNGNAQTPTNLSLFQPNTALPALTFTTSAAGNFYGDAQIDINNGAVNVVVKFTLTSGTVSAKVTATIERLI